MPGSFDAILFDLGDTLLYFDSSFDDIMAQANELMLRCLQKAGLPLGHDFIEAFDKCWQEYARQRETEFIEYTLHYILRNLLEEWDYAEAPEGLLRDCLAQRHLLTQAHWIPETDALPTLETLRAGGYRLGLISNASDDANTQVLIDKAGIRSYFEVILSSAAEGIRKPNPLIFHRALQRMGGITPGRTAMVGDTLGADILGAHNAGIFGIWITRRADTPANRTHTATIFPDAKIDALSELPPLLKTLTSTA